MGWRGRGKRSAAEGPGSGGQSPGQCPGGTVEMSGHSQIRDYLLFGDLVFRDAQNDSSDVSSPRHCLPSGNGKESETPTSVEKRANPGEAVTEAVFSPLTFPDFSDAATAML